MGYEADDILATAARIAMERGWRCVLGTGDKDARHGDVTRVIDLVKQEGVAKFAINIEPIPMPAAAGAP